MSRNLFFSSSRTAVIYPALYLFIYLLHLWSICCIPSWLMTRFIFFCFFQFYHLLFCYPALYKPADRAHKAGSETAVETCIDKLHMIFADIASAFRAGIIRLALTSIALIHFISPSSTAIYYKHLGKPIKALTLRDFPMSNYSGCPCKVFIIRHIIF